VNLWTPGVDEAHTFRLSMFTWRRVNTAVIWLSMPGVFSE